ncbi:MAG: histidine kinase [Solirubrobacteraceae bacterium]
MQANPRGLRITTSDPSGGWPAPAWPGRFAAAEDAVRRWITLAAMAMLILGLLQTSFAQKWPLVTSLIVLGVGLAADRLARVMGRGARSWIWLTPAAVVALGVLISQHASDALVGQWPVEVAVPLLGAALVASPVARLMRGRAVSGDVPGAAAVLTITVLAEGLLVKSPYSPWWPSIVCIIALGAGLGLASLARALGQELAGRFVQAALAITSMAVLISQSSNDYVAPHWPLTAGLAILGVGLLTEPVAHILGRSQQGVLKARLDELSRSRRGVVDVQATELRRIERDLHDGAQARLVALAMKLGRAERRFGSDPDIADVLKGAREDATLAIRELRELARGIAPPVLTDRGLEAATRSLALGSIANLEIRSELRERPAAVVETAAYFVVAEALTNAAKHAPGAPVEVHLDERGGDLFVEITDFGPGGADASGGGLTGLRHRVEALDGTLHVTSRPGVGTQVEAMLPCGR